MSWLTVLAQVQIHHRASDCESNNGFCPDWIVKNFGDRYVDPFFRHLELVVISVVDRLRDRVRARRSSPTGGAGWSGPVIGLTGILYTIPSVAAFLLLSRSPAAGCSPR